LIGNVSPNTINQISSSISGVDTVNNPSAFSNGYDKESDNNFRLRFIAYINSLSKGTLLAYQTAITNGTPSIFYNIIENYNFLEVPQLGFVTIIIDDGSGNPPPSLITHIQEKINTVRALAIQVAVYPVVILSSIITVDILINPLYNQQSVIGLVNNAVSLYISTLKIGQPLIYTKLFQIIYSASEGIIEVSNLIINGLSVDLIPSFKERIFLSSLTISVI
jgi:phage-related baseplate assembly protein